MQFHPPDYHLYWHKLKECRQKIHELNKAKRSENPDEKKVKELEKLVEKLEMEIRKITKRDPDCHSWEFFIPPNTDAGFEKLIHDLDLETAIFRRDNVEEIKKTFGLGGKRKRKVTDVGQVEKYDNVFPCKPDTKWDQIKIELIDDDAVWVETPQAKGRFSYSELGMAHRRSGKPTHIWIYLKLFATHNGNLSGEIEEPVKRVLWRTYQLNYNEDLPYFAKRLNSHMKKLFNIKDSIYKYHYKKYKSYITKITFSLRTNFDKSSLPRENTEKPLHETEVEDIQNKLSISDSKRFDG